MLRRRNDMVDFLAGVGVCVCLSGMVFISVFLL